MSCLQIFAVQNLPRVAAALWLVFYHRWGTLGSLKIAEHCTEEKAGKEDEGARSGVAAGGK